MTGPNKTTIIEVIEIAVTNHVVIEMMEIDKETTTTGNIGIRIHRSKIEKNSIEGPMETITETIAVDGAKETIRKISRMSRVRNEPRCRESSRWPVITLSKFVMTPLQVSLMVILANLVSPKSA